MADYATLIRPTRPGEEGRLQNSGQAWGRPWIRHVRRSAGLCWPDDTIAVVGAGPSFTSSISDDDTVGICWFCVLRATASRVSLKICSTEAVEEFISSRSAVIS